MDNEKQLAALREKVQVRILALESSCDETAAAVIENGRRILSNVVFSQIDLHALYGGVVPEIASRQHVEALPADSAAPKGKLTEILQKRAMAAQPALSGTEDRL